MSEASGARKAFEDSLRRVDELIEGMRAERDRIKVEFERRLETVRFGRVDRGRFFGVSGFIFTIKVEKSSANSVFLFCSVEVFEAFSWTQRGNIRYSFGLFSPVCHTGEPLESKALVQVTRLLK